MFETHPELRHVQCYVLVERIQYDLGDPLVTPRPMNQ